EGDVMAQQLEGGIGQQVLDVVPGAGEEVVDTQHVAPLRQQPLAQVRSEESGTASDQDALAQRVFGHSIGGHGIRRGLWYTGRRGLERIGGTRASAARGARTAAHRVAVFPQRLERPRGLLYSVGLFLNQELTLMRVTIFGSGYVGLVTGACLADAGNHVVCVDVDAGKIERLNRGEVPIHEPGLDALIKRNAEAGRLEFTTDALRGVEHGLFQLIAVGTPPDEDGSADLRYVLAAARTIASHMSRYCVVVTKSTVPVGTADKVRRELENTLEARAAAGEFDVVSNPEFLKEGAAIQDFMKPDRVVVGTD